MDQNSESFAEWERRTAEPLTVVSWLKRCALVLVAAAFGVLSATGHLMWAIVIALVAGTSLWVSERVLHRPAR